ncbi:MAG: hypothetical protein RL100_457 [Actinomycetota bacterium]
MRFYVKDSERKPDPQPVKTNTRLVILVGLGLWLLALVFCFVFAESLAASQESWLATCGFGILLGIYAFFHVRRR